MKNFGTWKVNWEVVTDIVETYEHAWCGTPRKAQDCGTQQCSGMKGPQGTKMGTSCEDWYVESAGPQVPSPTLCSQISSSPLKTRDLFLLRKCTRDTPDFKTSGRLWLRW